MTINDGKGLFDNVGMCDVIATGLNNAVRSLLSGNSIQFCQKVSEISVQLANLKQGIRDDLASKDQMIEELKRINNELANQNVKDGGNLGTD